MQHSGPIPTATATATTHPEPTAMPAHQLRGLQRPTAEVVLTPTATATPIPTVAGPWTTAPTLTPTTPPAGATLTATATTMAWTMIALPFSVPRFMTARGAPTKTATAIPTLTADGPRPTALMRSCPTTPSGTTPTATATATTRPARFRMLARPPTASRGKTAPTAVRTAIKTDGATTKTRTPATNRNGQTVTGTATVTTPAAPNRMPAQVFGAIQPKVTGLAAWTTTAMGGTTALMPCPTSLRSGSTRTAMATATTQRVSSPMPVPARLEPRRRPTDALTTTATATPT